jgi:hypothetical protein
MLRSSELRSYPDRFVVIFCSVSRQMSGEYLKISSLVTDRYISYAFSRTSLNKIEVNNTNFY